MDDTPQGLKTAQEDAPLTPEQERFMRRVRLISVMGAFIIFAGFGLVLFTILVRLGEPAETTGSVGSPITGESLRAELRLDPAERITAAESANGMLTLVVTRPDGPGRVIVLDLETLTVRREIEGVAAQ